MPKLSTATRTSTSLATSITPAPTISGVTVAITTTFTPAPTCNPSHFTQLSSPGYLIWVAAPNPVPSVTANDCYPSQWIQNFATAGPSGVSSMAPFVDGLVCPSGWTSAFGAANDYMACCPESYKLRSPASTIDPNRPAYGGTCYSDIGPGTTLHVTAYNSASVTATAEFTATASGQVYAHPIDGFAYKGKDNEHSVAAATQTSSSSSTDSSSDSSNSTVNHRSSNSLPAGAIAGIAVGSFAALAAVAAIVAFLMMRKKKRNSYSQKGFIVKNYDYYLRSSMSRMDSTKSPPEVVVDDVSSQKTGLSSNSGFNGSLTTISELSTPMPSPEFPAATRR